MSDRHITIIQTKSYPGGHLCGGIVTTHVFLGDSEEDLQETVEKQLLEWLDMIPRSEGDAEEDEAYEEAKKNLLEFARGETEGDYDSEYEQTIFTHINRYDEFTQIYGE
jgi:hypothetical protein